VKRFSQRIVLILATGLLLTPEVQSQVRLKPDGDRIRKELTFLASDSLKGRETGTPEADVAAYTVARVFKSAGLKPLFTPRQVAADDDSTVTSGFEQPDSLALYFQRFSIMRSRLADKQEFGVITALPQGSQISRYNLPSDYYMQHSGQVSVSATAPVVFAGFGIDTGPGNYSDYTTEKGEALSVSGKAVLVMDGYPKQEDTASTFTKSRKPIYINALRKADAARARGAIALLVVEPRRDGASSFEQKYERVRRSLTSWRYTLPSRSESGIPIIYVSRKVARDILDDSGYSLDSLYTLIDGTLRPRSTDLKQSVHISVNFDVQSIPTQNVAGILRGSDPVLADEAIVIGAHYDHVGLGHHGSLSRKLEGQVHNGADDNGSGTVGVMELARLLPATTPKRTIVFIAFAGEEEGLLGSAFYVNDQPLHPLKKTVTMLNLDMIGRNEDSLLWVGGAFYSRDVKKIAEEANKEVGFNLLYNTGLLTFGSDQAGFIRRQIPAMFLFSGLHDDYHTPSDDVGKINFTKMARVIQLAANIIQNVANRPDKPKYEELPIPERTKLVQESLNVMRRFRPQDTKK
jgi:Zn-dependent M28 family amino/carboxypeptidase